MRTDTIRSLNDLNRRFYEESAGTFHRTRRGPWPGWRRTLERATPRLRQGEPLRVLDVGCGNGRFAELLDASFEYVGVDFSAALLAEANAGSIATCPVSLLCFDLLNESPAERLAGQSFDLITLFGLMHHIPARSRRSRLLADLGSLLAPEALLAVSFWDFEREQRLRAKIVGWDRMAQLGAAPFDPDDLEAGDHLLSFGDDPAAVRYCHFAAEPERRELMDAASLTVVDEFRADGRERDLNHYLIATRSP